MQVPLSLLPHSVTVEPYAGTGAYGDLYGPPKQVRCFVQDKRRMVRDATGARVVSESTLICRLDHVDDFAPGSKVTTNGRTATVITAYRQDGGRLPVPSHLEVALT